MFEHSSTLRSFTTALQDIVLTVVAFGVAYWVRSDVLTYFVGPHILRPEIYPFRQYLPLLLMIVVVWWAGGRILGIYHNIHLRTHVIQDLIKLIVLGMFAVNALLYLFRAYYVSRAFVLTIAVVDFVFLALGRWASLSSVSWIRSDVQWQQHCLIVGTGPAAIEVGKLIKDGESRGMRLIGFVTTRGEKSPVHMGVLSHIPVFSLEEASGVLRNRIVDDLIVAVEQIDLAEVESLISRAHEQGVRTRLALAFLPQEFRHVHLENLSDVPLLTLATSPNSETALFAKRCADVVLSAIGLIVLSPVMLLLAFLVRFTSPGPVLYRQVRCGLNGRRFELIKFRSMVLDAEALRSGLERFNEMDGVVFKMANDPRCTKLGLWMRRFGLDELPQLWNVLRGEMSIVGPRPPLAGEVEQYSPRQLRRLRMRPGMTCLWVVVGTERWKSFNRLVQLDLAYMDNWSLWLDVKIIIKTIPRALLGRGTG